MEDLIIVGAGGTSQDVAEAVADINQVERTWNLLGYVDDDPEKLGRQFAGFGVLGTIEEAAKFSGARFIIGMGNSKNPLLRKTIAQRLGLTGDRFATIIHPTATVSRHASVGFGVAILHGSIVSNRVKIGNHVLIAQASFVGHDGVIEDFVSVAPGAVLSGFVHVRQGAYLGAGSAIVPRAKIGEGALVGIGSVVTMDVEANRTVFGNPARHLSPVK